MTTAIMWAALAKTIQEKNGKKKDKVVGSVAYESRSVHNCIVFLKIGCHVSREDEFLSDNDAR